VEHKKLFSYPAVSLYPLASLSPSSLLSKPSPVFSITILLSVSMITTLKFPHINEKTWCTHFQEKAKIMTKSKKEIE
jgi:hypothetical protein